MLTYNIKRDGEDSLYVQLYNFIKDDIIKGNLKANEKLPSKRSFAKHLKISVMTIENAYSQLQLEGYIYSQERRGYFVSNLDEALLDKIHSNNTLNINQIKDRGVDDNRIDEFDYEFDFKSNHIYSEKFPFSTWAKIMRKILSKRDERLLKSMSYNGIEELRQAIAGHLYHFRGMRVSPNQIVIGSGTEYLYGLLILLLGRDKVYAIEDPGYQKIGKIYKSNGVSCDYIPLDKSGLLVEELEKSSADIVHISPAHHFPTGIVMPIKRRHELLKWANKEEGRYIIEDEYDSEFRYLGIPIQTLQSIDHNQKVIYINTFSKSIAPSIRISYMVLPSNLAQEFKERLGFYSCTVPSFEQLTLAKFISEGYFERHINRMSTHYNKQRNKIIKSIKDNDPDEKVTILEEDSGLHFLLKLNTDMTDKEIVSTSRKASIRLSCLSEYYYNKQAKKDGVILINYSGIDYDRIEEAISRLMKILMSDL